MSKMVYIAGPVTGRPDRNRSAFEDAAMTVQLLTGLPSQRVKVPHSITSSYDSEAVAMQRCLNWICAQVEDGLYPLTVVLIDGWRDSLGTAVEVALARKLGVPVVELVGEELREVER